MHQPGFSRPKAPCHSLHGPTLTATTIQGGRENSKVTVSQENISSSNFHGTWQGTPKGHPLTALPQPGMAAAAEGK